MKRSKAIKLAVAGLVVTSAVVTGAILQTDGHVFGNAKAYQVCNGVIYNTDDACPGNQQSPEASAPAQQPPTDQQPQSAPAALAAPAAAPSSPNCH